MRESNGEEKEERDRLLVTAWMFEELRASATVMCIFVCN